MIHYQFFYKDSPIHTHDCNTYINHVKGENFWIKDKAYRITGLHKNYLSNDRLIVAIFLEQF